MKRLGIILCYLLLVSVAGCVTKESVETSRPDSDRIEVVYFHTPSCPSCQRLSRYFKTHKHRDQFSLKKISMDGPIENVSTLRQYYEEYDVPRSNWSGLMAVFMKDQYYGSFDAVYEHFDKDLEQYLGSNES